MEEIYNVWRYEVNDTLYTDETIATITASNGSGKNFRQDYLDIVRSIPGLGIHPNIIPRTKKISEIKTDDEKNPALLFNMEASYENGLRSKGVVMDNSTLLCILVVLQKYDDITTLDLADSQLTNQSINILAKYLPETSITTLNLDYNKNINDNCENLISATHGSKLVSISLRGCNLNDDTIKRIVEKLWINGSLNELNLFNNKISDAGGHLLSRMLRYNHSIKKLYLGSNHMSSSSFIKFAIAVSCEYGPISSEEKEERNKVCKLQEKNPFTGGDAGGGKKGKKGKGKKGGSHGGGPLRIDEMDEETGICKGNDSLIFLDLSYNGQIIDDTNSIKEYFSSDETKFCASLKKIDFSYCKGINDGLLKVISDKINGILSSE